MVHLRESKYRYIHWYRPRVNLRDESDLIARTYTIMTQFTNKKRHTRRTRKLSRSCHRDRIENRYIIIESTISWNAVDETSILENREIFIANWRIRVLRSSLFPLYFLVYSSLWYLLAEFEINLNEILTEYYNL